MTQRAYIAGPCNSGPLSLEVNKKNAELMTMVVSRMGYLPFNPITNFFEMGAIGISERNILYFCLRELKGCDVLIHAPNWQVSAGAQIENMFAEALNMPIIVLDKEHFKEHKIGGYVYTQYKDIPEIFRGGPAHHNDEGEPGPGVDVGVAAIPMEAPN